MHKSSCACASGGKMARFILTRPPTYKKCCNILISKMPKGYQPSPNTFQVNSTLKSKFQQVIGLLLYIMFKTQLEIAFPVTKLSQHAANPTEDHLSRALLHLPLLIGDCQLLFGL